MVEIVPSSATLVVAGSGKVNAPATVATLRLSVIRRSAQAAEALDAAALASQSVIQAAVQLGIGKQDITTTRISVKEITQEPGKRGGKWTVVGHTASSDLAVRIPDIQRIGATVRELIAAGATSIDGVELDAADKARLRDDSLRAAVDDARRKAEILATAAGVRLAGIRQIREVSLRYHSPRRDYSPLDPLFKAPDSMSVDMPFEPGEVAQSASVEVTWWIEA